MEGNRTLRKLEQHLNIIVSKMFKQSVCSISILNILLNITKWTICNEILTNIFVSNKFLILRNVVSKCYDIFTFANYAFLYKYFSILYFAIVKTMYFFLILLL